MKRDTNKIDDYTMIDTPVRKGWAVAAKRQHEEGEDEMLDQDILNDDLLC